MMNYKNKIVAGTGHRLQKIGGFKIPNPTYNWIWDNAKKVIEILEPSKIISGMAIGYDQILAEIAIKLNIPLIAAIPFKGQESMWPKESQEKYNNLLDNAQEIVIVSDGGYSAAKMQIRNCWMTDNSEITLMCFNGDNSGGTANNVKYSMEKNKLWARIDPDKKEVTFDERLGIIWP